MRSLWCELKLRVEHVKRKTRGAATGKEGPPDETGGIQPAGDLGDVLLSEFQAIRARRDTIERGVPQKGLGELTADPTCCESEKVKDYYDKVHKLGNVSALCLSGGGIRSAAFALGVVQGLARRELLTKFDFLSTVSGGGYLGGCLAAWAQRHGYEQVAKELAEGSQSNNGISPLLHLRRYSSYLTPRNALLSGDMLTVIALFLRNLALNWLILIPFLVIVVWAVKVIAFFVWWLEPGESVIALFGALALALIGAALLDSLQQRPGWTDQASNRKRFFRWELLPMLVGSSMVSLAALKYYGVHPSEPLSTAVLDPVLGITLIVGGLHLLAGVFALVFHMPTPVSQLSPNSSITTIGPFRGLLVYLAFVTGGTMGGYALASTISLVSASQISPASRTFLLISVGPPLVMIALFLSELVYIGLTSYVRWGDAEREWLARAAGNHGRAAIGWLIALVLVFGGSWAVFFLSNRAGGILAAAGAGGLAGAVTAGVGAASTTAATLKRYQSSIKNLSARVILAVAMPVFIAVAVSFVSAGIDAYVAHQQLWFPDPKVFSQDLWWRLGWLGFVVVVIGICASLFVNPNRFSLHGVYRNRLIRAFLGASNKRKPDSFTDFDPHDNLNLSNLWPQKTTVGDCPPQLLVMNMALNIVATKELAWQERKALSSTATPLWIGCGDLKQADAELPKRHGYYRKADEYGGPMSLGTAMTISGAAASPNMGYHSSPALSVLLTTFNVRLGAWLGNPGPAGDSSYRHEGPRFAAGPLLQEALGQTTEDKRYVYLSDGGHFENLGLYEMVRRRCHLILVTDAGCDPQCGFEDLGNALLKISVDLHVSIKFRALKIGARRAPPERGPYCAVADIYYPENRDCPAMMIYLKPGYQGIEPPSVRSYAAKHPAFPHETTADQWFGEAQFEAYRALGVHIMDFIDGERPEPYSNVREFLGTVAERTREACDFDESSISVRLKSPL